MFSFLSNIPPSREKVIVKYLRSRLKMSENDATKIAQVVPDTEGSAIAIRLAKYPPEQSLPAIVYILSYATPKGDNERAREVVSLTQAYGRLAKPILLELAKGKLVPEFIGDFLKYYSKQGMTVLINRSYFFSIRGLLEIKGYLSEDEIESVVNFVNSSSEMWRTGGWDDEKVETVLNGLCN